MDMKKINIKVPNIGDNKDLEIIEILVSESDFVESEQSLIILESGKSSIEIPSTHSGTIKSIKVRLGDKVSEGSIILELLENKVKENKNSKIKNNNFDICCDLLVLGAGPGGYSAAFLASDLGMNVVLVNNYSELGGVCLNVGCIPSKTLLHITYIMEEALKLKDSGVKFFKPLIDIEKIKNFKEITIKKLTKGLSNLSKLRKLITLKGKGIFIDSFHLEVFNGKNSKIVKFNHAIIATGSSSLELPIIPKDKRIISSTGALSLKQIPNNMLLIGGGVVGLEIGTIYSSLGSRLDLIENSDCIMKTFDQDLIKIWKDKNIKRFDEIMTNTKIISVETSKEGIHVNFKKNNSGVISKRYDLVLQSVGRYPNSSNIGIEKLDIYKDRQGFIDVDNQMRTSNKNIFAIGDVVGKPMLAHKAVHEGHIAAQVISGEKIFFDAKSIPYVSYTNPEISWVGINESELKYNNTKFKKVLINWSSLGRAVANCYEYGLTKLIFGMENNNLLGGGIVGTSAGDLISEIALGIEMGCNSTDISKTIHPHPTLSESICMASSVIEETCTDMINKN